jgi:RNA polymerase sigma-70 factor (ECF subfamily)
MKWTEISEDEVLMHAYQLGDFSAFETLYKRYSGRVLGYVRKKVMEPSQADDIFQSVFLKLHNSRQRYNSTLPFQPWLFTICRNAVLDYWRKTQRDQAVVQSDSIENIPAPTVEEARSLPDLSSLSAAQRKAIELRYIQDLSFEKISKILETSPSNTRQILSRAIRGLKNVMHKKEAS